MKLTRPEMSFAMGDCGAAVLVLELTTAVEERRRRCPRGEVGDLGDVGVKVSLKLILPFALLILASGVWLKENAARLKSGLREGVDGAEVLNAFLDG